MPLIINGSPSIPRTEPEDFIKSYPHFQDSSISFLKNELRDVGPKELLYISQREVAGTSPDDNIITILGSDDATTCHIAILRHTGSGATSLIHFDGCQIMEGLNTMISIVKQLTPDFSSGRLEFHLFGGFLDNRRNSHGVCKKVLNALHKTESEIHLMTACIIDHNTIYKNSVPFPVIYGIAINVKTGEMFQATFSDKGPDKPLRDARHFTGNKENIMIYDSSKKELVIGPFDYRQFRDVDMIISLPDDYIRQFLSTSPEQEPPRFAESVRATLRQLRDYPNPLQSVFVGGLPRRYKKDQSTGAWIKAAE